jgi:hypothetical protein
MADDWRIRITIGDGAGGLFDRLGDALSGEAAELAAELEKRRLAVSRDGDDLFVYASSGAEAERARDLIGLVIKAEQVEATTSQIEHWLDDEDRWDDEPPGETWEEEELERGYAPWEVRVTLSSHSEASALAETLEAEGYGVDRRWRHLIVGAASKEDAETLAQRLHGKVEPGGELVWETVPGNPFAIFGGLGSAGTPV